MLLVIFSFFSLSCPSTPLCDPQAHFCRTLCWKLCVCHQNTWKCGSKILRLFLFKGNFIFIHIMYEKFTYTDYTLLTVHGLDAGNCFPRTPFKMNFLPLFRLCFNQSRYLMCMKWPVNCSRTSDYFIWKLADPFLSTSKLPTLKHTRTYF